MKKKSKIRLPDFNELTKRISFVDVLVRYHLLEGMHKKGDQLRGICPIHQGAENKNSFSVNTIRNCFQCFSCGSQGNILDFVAAMENCNKVKAGRFLEQWFSVGSYSPSAGRQSKGKGGDNTGRGSGKGVRDKRVQEKNKGGCCEDGNSRNGVDEVVKDSPGQDPPVGGQGKNVNGGINPPLTFVLKNLDAGHPYLLERVKPKTAKRFGLGFCNRGLMAGRVVVPIHDENGQLVAYVGRWPGDDGFPENEGKYKFPPDFKKGYVLFNLHRVIEAVKRGEPLILVEGFFDVFRLYEMGYPNALALMGASLTEGQEDLLKSVLSPVSRVVLLFDNDTAGKACLRDVANRLSAWCFIKIARLPEGINQPDQLKERIEFF